MAKRYNIGFVGAGPATMYALLRLVELGYTGSILVIDKGKSIENRAKTDVLFGGGGAGTYSDFKLSFSLTVGGIIPGVTQEDCDVFDKWLIQKLNNFRPDCVKNPFAWESTVDYPVGKSGLTWDKHKVLHIGTDNGLLVNKAIFNFLYQQPNIEFKFEHNLVDIDFAHDSCFIDCAYKLLYKNKDEFDYVDKLVLATGRYGTVPNIVLEKLDAKRVARPFSLGVRVQDTINSQYEAIIKANYDFKFVKEYSYENGVKCRVRTFCCNSGNAHLAVERSKNFVAFNGHAYRQPDLNNHTVNYGIVCEVSGLPYYHTKDSQIALMKAVNELPYWESDNLKDNQPVPARKLLDGFEQLRGVYPNEVIDALTDFVSRLNKVVNLEQAHYLYPEIKLSDTIPEVNSKTFEINHDQVYMLGDCLNTGSIAKAAYEGYLFANGIMGSEEK